MAKPQASIAVALHSMVIFIGLLTLVVGIGGLVDIHGEIWFAFLLLCGAALMMIISGIVGLRKAGRNRKNEEALIQKMEDALRGNAQAPFVAQEDITQDALPQENQPAGSNPENWVLPWQYGESEWALFQQAESKRINQDQLVFFVLMTLVGTAVLRITRTTDWTISVLFAMGFAALVAGLGWWRDNRRLDTKGRKPSVVITPKGILVNDQFHPWNDGDNVLGDIRMWEENQAGGMEFEIRYKNSRGTEMKKEIRIPVPAGKEAEARSLISLLKPAL